MNPIAGNQFTSRAESGAAAVELWKPLIPFFSAGKGRVDLGQTAAHFTKAAAELEGFARPLFGLVPLAAGGLPFDHWDMFAEGLSNGAAPDHPDFWGVPRDRDQRIVESAALGFSLALAPETVWDPLSGAARDNLANWLKHTLTLEVPKCNWYFFNVLVSLGLERVGVEHDMGARQRALVALDSYYLDEGWYCDGPSRRLDHYIPFAFHFYGLIYTKLAPEDTARDDRYRERAVAFAQQFRNWFAEDGASLAFGRSMTYRFAQCSFWGALTFADVEALPWGEVRGIWARNMRWWAERDYFDRDGVMSIGYCYPTLHMSENYNSPGSPYWAMKAFLPLALGDDHPFWATPEADGKPAEGITKSVVPGMLAYGEKNNNVILSSGSELRRPIRCAQEKYCKFAYSTHFGFSVDGDTRSFQFSAYDNMLAFSDDGGRYFARHELEDAWIGEDFLYSTWVPGEGIAVETWLIARPPWHLRVHVVRCARPFMTLEGGFAIERTDVPAERIEEGRNAALVHKGGAWSTIINLDTGAGFVARDGWIRNAMASTSLHFPQTHVPQLAATLPEGESVLAAAVIGSPNVDRMAAELANVPVAPPVADLREMLKSAKRVGAMQYKEEAT
ncbi:MAG: DUF2264 domain-containing protein [Hyphomicrobiales bacterium]|nr:DUF2264 domain-containing protein [Hyphomicrobiales bacterium]